MIIESRYVLGDLRFHHRRGDAQQRLFPQKTIEPSGIAQLMAVAGEAKSGEIFEKLRWRFFKHRMTLEVTHLIGRKLEIGEMLDGLFGVLPPMSETSDWPADCGW